ncbi:hypothetical protein WDJ51_03965 [Rathayibacter sp. YIM 133350]|uniref:hypothetical protein n=1 Tax=Rathayibacter sp. YIM 133350 TaxID=3131992 RepID=UPI00307E7B41
MSTLKHPVGPQPNKVYWRRRILLGLGLIAVIVAIILIVVRPGASSGEPSDSSARTATTTTPSTAANSTTIPTEATEADGKACKKSVIAVSAITDKTTYAPGENPQLSLSITNTGSKPCVFNAGTKQQVFTITSGDEKYWVSTDCQSDAVDAQVTLKPGVPIASAAPITWDRTRSAADTCDSAREGVPAGGASYHLTVSVDGVDSESTQFMLG